MRNARAVAWIPTRALVGVLVALVAAGAVANPFAPTRPATHYFMPDGYVGWVRIDYGVSDGHARQLGVERALPLPMRDGVIVAEIPRTGHLVTSSPMQFGGAKDEFYYRANGRLTPLSQAKGNEMIWNKFNGILGPGMQTEMFFIGSEADYKRYGERREPVPRPGPVQR